MATRVLQVVTQMNRDGMESRLMDIYRNIDRERVQFDFYTFRQEKGQYDQEIISLGGKVFYNDPLAATSLHASRARLIKFLTEPPGYSIVHCHMNAWCSLILGSAKTAGVPVRIAHSRTALNKISIQNIIKNIIKLPVNRYATHRLAVSMEAAIWLFGRKAVEQGLVEVWANAIDYDKFSYNIEARESIRRELKLNDNLVLMHVGNYRFEKNHQFLLKIFKAVQAKRPSSILVIVGRGDWSEIQQQAEQLGVSNNVVYTGSRSDVNYLLQAADVFVFPSLYEGLPGAVLEAQAAGLPCIISDTITNEVCITPLVEQLPLSMKPEGWADRILACNNSNRGEEKIFFEEKGFSLENLVAKMTEFYLASPYAEQV